MLNVEWLNVERQGIGYAWTKNDLMSYDKTENVSERRKFHLACCYVGRFFSLIINISAPFLCTLKKASFVVSSEIGPFFYVICSGITVDPRDEELLDQQRDVIVVFWAWCTQPARSQSPRIWRSAQCAVNLYSPLLLEAGVACQIWDSILK
jgi:hypothetical protein